MNRSSGVVPSAEILKPISKRLPVVIVVFVMNELSNGMV